MKWWLEIFPLKIFTSCLYRQGTNIPINQGVPQTCPSLKNACSVNMLLSITNRVQACLGHLKYCTAFSMLWRGTVVCYLKKKSLLYIQLAFQAVLWSLGEIIAHVLFIKFIAGLFFSVKNTIFPLPFLPDCFLSWEVLEQFTCLLGHARSFLASWATGWKLRFLQLRQMVLFSCHTLTL